MVVLDGTFSFAIIPFLEF